MIFNNWNVLANELDKAIKSFEELNGRHSRGTISRRQINDFKFLFAMFVSFWVSCKVLFNHNVMFNYNVKLQCAISGYGCCDVRPRLNIYLSLRTCVIDEVSEIEKIYVKTISWWK